MATPGLPWHGPSGNPSSATHSTTHMGQQFFLTGKLNGVVNQTKFGAPNCGSASDRLRNNKLGSLFQSPTPGFTLALVLVAVVVAADQ